MAYAVAQAKARREISGLAKDLQSSLNESDRRLKMSNRNLTSLSFERGHAACERGEIGRGLLWLVESWHTAIATDDEGWRHTARASVSAWQRHYARPKAVFSHAGQISRVAFSPDGKTVLTASYDNSARLWNATTGQPLGLPLTHQAIVSAIAFSPDGETVLTGSLDKTARLWGAATGQPIGPPLTHSGTVYGVAYSPDGKTVLTGSTGNTARLWDVLELPDSHERIATWVQVITGLNLDDRGTVSVMDSANRHERREMLDKLGVQPMTASRWSLGTILLRP